MYVTFVFLHAAFMADEFWGDMIEPARTHFMRLQRLMGPWL